MNFSSRGIVRLVSVAALSATVSVGASAAAFADNTTPSPAPSSQPNRATFGIGTADGKAVDKRGGFSLVQARGGSVNDHIALVNLSDKPLPINVYAVDATIGADGTVTLEARDQQKNDAGSWVKLDLPGGKSPVVVPAHHTTIIPFSVTVPKDAEVGDHVAGVVGSITAQGGGAGSPNVALEQRVGLRLDLRVAGPLKPQLSIENLHATYAGTLNPFGKGRVVVTYTIRNTGNIRIGGSQNVVVKGLVGGSTEASDLRDIPTLLPGTAVDVTSVISDVFPLGYMNSQVTVDAIAPPSDADPSMEVSTASTHFWAIPWTLLAIVLALIGIIVGILRRRRTPPAQEIDLAGQNPLATPPAGPALLPTPSGDQR